MQLSWKIEEQMQMNFISVIRIQSFLPSMIILGGQEEIMSETKREVEEKVSPLRVYAWWECTCKQNVAKNYSYLCINFLFPFIKTFLNFCSSNRKLPFSLLP